MTNTLEKAVSNREEIKPAKTKSELPLVAFTLLGQMAAGIAVFALFSGPLTVPVSVTIGGVIGLGGLASLLHLGAPKNAWRAVIHLRKSWLSREILMFGLFWVSWLVSLAMPGMGKLPLAVCGLGLVFSMAQVYRLRSMPAWDTSKTLLAFLVSALLLGGLGLNILDRLGNTAPTPFTVLTVGTGLVAALVLSLTDRNQTHQTTRRFRLGLIGLGVAGVLGTYIIIPIVGSWLVVPIFIVVLAEETLGRWLFYEELQQRIL